MLFAPVSPAINPETAEVSVRAVLALVVLLAEAWAIAQVLGSGEPGLRRLGWVLVIVLLPVLGIVLWLRSGPRPSNSVRSAT